MPRRALLAGILGVPLAGCSGADALSEQRAAATSALPAPAAIPAGPDAGPVARARASASLLMGTAEQLARAWPQLARLLRDVAAAHRAHLAALGAPVPPVASPSPSGSPSRRQGRERELAAAVAAEHAAAGVALDDVQLASPLVAALLARIAAARAVHADLLAAAGDLPAPGGVAPAPVPTGTAPGVAVPSPTAAAPTPTGTVSSPGLVPLPTATTSPPASSPSPASTAATASAAAPLSTAARDALATWTTGEHAAVFAYGVVVARVRGGDRARARAAWAWHVARRDVLEERLLAAGMRPPAAAPAYSLDAVSGPGAAVRLATTVERRLTAVAVRAVAATTGDDRRQAAASLVEGARLAAAWSGRTQPLPG